jgi:cell wall-associated NlpC family hydrolase
MMAVKLFIFILSIMLFTGCATHHLITASAPHPPMNEMSNKTVTKIDKFYKTWKGTPYAYGGCSKNGVDCSCFTKIAYKDLFNKNIPRTAKGQYDSGIAVDSNNLKPGDLVFFSFASLTNWDSWHVGVYLINGKFIQAASSGVMISSLNEPHIRSRYIGARRW